MTLALLLSTALAWTVESIAHPVTATTYHSATVTSSDGKATLAMFCFDSSSVWWSFDADVNDVFDRTHTPGGQQVQVGYRGPSIPGDLHTMHPTTPTGATAKGITDGIGRAVLTDQGAGSWVSVKLYMRGERAWQFDTSGATAALAQITSACATTTPRSQPPTTSSGTL